MGISPCELKNRNQSQAKADAPFKNAIALEETQGHHHVERGGGFRRPPPVTLKSAQAETHATLRSQLCPWFDDGIHWSGDRFT